MATVRNDRDDGGEKNVHVNGTEKKKRVQTRRLTSIQFVKVCDEMRKHKEVLLEMRPTLVECAAMLSKSLGFEVPDSCINDAKEASQVQWESKGLKTKIRKGGTENSGRTLCRALLDLYIKLGEEVPQSLVKLMDGYNNRKQAKNPEVPDLNELAKKSKQEVDPQNEPKPAEERIDREVIRLNKESVGDTVFKVGDVVTVDNLTRPQEVTKVTVTEEGHYVQLDGLYTYRAGRVKLSKKAVGIQK